MALSLTFIVVFYVPVYFLFYSVKCSGNNSVVAFGSFKSSVNKSDNDTKQASNNDAPNPIIHSITKG